MAAQVDFGWRVPDFPVDGNGTATFLRQIAQMLDLTEGRFASAWVADHVVPWAQWQAPETPTVECWTTLHFHACTPEECFIPERLTFALPMHYRPFSP